MASLEQRKYDGEQSRQVLENEAFSRAFDDIRKELMDAWTQSPARDEQGREKLYLMVKLTDKLESVLRRSMEDGQLAALELERQRTLMQRAREWAGMES